MKSRLNLVETPVEVRRCQPLLGTFVDISATGESEPAMQTAVDAAFATIRRIEQMMNAHAANSELSLVNREAVLRPVRVSPELFEVLRRADRLAGESGGAFDHTVASTLADWEYLPAELQRARPGSWTDVALLPDGTVYFFHPVALDLGGIAKGYAVDCAMAVLQQHGVSAAVVNAGGDLRVFGPQPAVIFLRHPENPQLLAETLQLSNAALATSSPCFTEKSWAGKRVSHLVNPLRQTAVTGVISVSVRAPECWLADALTKVVLNAPDRAPQLLKQYGAETFILRA